MAPKFGDRPIAIIKQGGTAEAAISDVGLILTNLARGISYSHGEGWEDKRGAGGRRDIGSA